MSAAMDLGETEQPLTMERFKQLTSSASNDRAKMLNDRIPAFTQLPSEERLMLEPETGLGALDIFPLEIKLELVSWLDIRSLFTLTRVNKAGWMLLVTHPEYKAIQMHATVAVRGLFSIKAATLVTCGQLYQALSTAGCETCGTFGGHIYLLTCKRVCYTCLTSNNMYLPLTTKDAARRYGVSQTVVKTLPSMTVVEGRYSESLHLNRASTLIDHESARVAGIRRHGSERAMQAYVSTLYAQRIKKTDEYKRSQNAAMLTYHDPRDMGAQNPHRFTAIVRVPWLDRKGGTVEYGVKCPACEAVYRPREPRGQLYTFNSFANHIKKCGEIVGRYHMPLEGQEFPL